MAETRLPQRATLSEVGGWCPTIFALAQELGLMTAVVYGLVWYHCNMRDGVCWASQSRLAELANVSRRSIVRHIERLCQAGYLLDVTPDLRGKPHTYADTGKARLRFLIDASIDGTASDQPDLPRPVTESHTTCDGESQPPVTESHTNRTSKETNSNSPVAVLRCLGIPQELADKWYRDYGEERVSAVLDASARATENRAGWIRRALEEEWNLGDSDVEAAKQTVLLGLDEEPYFLR